MHIALVNQHYWPYDQGGSGFSVRELAEGLARAGYQVTVIAQSRTQRHEHRVRAGVDIRHLAVANHFSASMATHSNVVTRALRQLYPEIHPRMASILRKELSAINPDIVHTHVLAGVSTRIWQVAQELGLPIVHTLRDYYLTCMRGTRVRNQHRCEKTCRDCSLLTLRRKKDCHYVDAIIGISEFVLNAHLDLGYFTDTPRQLVIPNGIHADQIRDNTANGVSSGTKKLRAGYLGRLHHSKGLDVFVEAFRLLGKESVYGYIAGSGTPKFQDQINREIKDLNLKVLGKVDPHKFLPDMDVLVVPSKFEEPFGRVILEANAHGVPVICAQRGGAQELVLPNVTGWLFEPDSPEQLTGILRQLSKQGIEESMRDACHARAGQFDLQNTIDAHKKLYSTLYKAIASPRQTTPVTVSADE